MPAHRKSQSGLGKFFNGLPSLSTRGKKSLVKAWPWIALIVGFTQLVAAYLLWDSVRSIKAVNSLFNSLVAYNNGINPVSVADKTLIYTGVVLLVVEGVLLLLATNKLKKLMKEGWNLVFLSAAINIIYAFVLLSISGREISSFLLTIIGSLLGFYLLYQVRDRYKK